MTKLVMILNGLVHIYSHTAYRNIEAVMDIATCGAARQRKGETYLDNNEGAMVTCLVCLGAELW